MNARYLLLSVLCILSAFIGSAENRFYCEDFAINPGETKVITFYLNNEVAYTGFQADIYFPEGITVNKNENDEYLFDLTSRKGDDHVLISASQSSGAIRLLSYSLTNKNYSGNEGAFVTCSVTADENFSGTKELRIDNIIFAESTEVETQFDPTTATITTASTTTENRFYCEDFAINPGETKVITFYLNNEVAYTGFQADIYFPEGITVNKNENDKYLFDLTSRKGDDHVLISASQSSGAIRLLSYSLTNKNYSGNEGAFVTCTVTADENFSGTKELRIDNIIFAESTEVETQFDPTTATITGPSAEIPETVQLAVLFPDRGKVAIDVPYNKAVTLTVFPNAVAGVGLSSATFNGVEIFDELDGNYRYTTPVLTENAVLSVVYISVPSGVDQSLANRIKVSASNGTVRVMGAAPESEVLVCDLSGKIVRKSAEKTFTLGEGIYVLNVEGLSFKFAM